jgi:hypothetical protein
MAFMFENLEVYQKSVNLAEAYAKITAEAMEWTDKAESRV